MKKKKHSFWYRNSLSLVFLGLMLLSLVGQIITGWKEHNQELEDLGGQTLPLLNYLGTGHFAQATFENWESEFLQMALYVILTIHLRQVGSSESKKLDEPEEVDREPKAHPKAPYPVKKGGWALSLYKHSLSLAFLLLFVISFWMHALGSLKDHNVQQQLQGKPTESFAQYLGGSKLWFESFQNWQSEFLAVAAIVVLSIFLRQQGSPESKPVDAAMEETGR